MAPLLALLTLATPAHGGPDLVGQGGVAVFAPVRALDQPGFALDGQLDAFALVDELPPELGASIGFQLGVIPGYCEGCRALGL